MGGGTEERLLQQGVELVDEEEERDKGLFEIPAILNHTVLFSIQIAWKLVLTKSILSFGVLEISLYLYD